MLEMLTHGAGEVQAQEYGPSSALVDVARHRGEVNVRPGHALELATPLDELPCLTSGAVHRQRNLGIVLHGLQLWRLLWGAYGVRWM